MRNKKWETRIKKKEQQTEDEYVVDRKENSKNWTYLDERP